jgi:ribosomal protein S18 acetylase RimI-like enzyme/SAM-dependent methyltransferase
MAPGDEHRVLEAAHLFDHPLQESAVRAFLADDRHHLLVAYVEGRPAGFVSAVELLHPDKPRPEAFLYELGVETEFRRLGVATALVSELIRVCRERGCGEMFVLTDEANDAAMATYRKADGAQEPDQVMFHWQWPPEIWPPGFARVPADDWVERPPEELALKYDTVQDHGWYRNLDPTLERLAAMLEPGGILLDYSGGTGILAERLLAELPGLELGILIVDASPKFLRVALDKLGGDERMGFRLIRYLDAERRLQTLQEALEPPLLERGVDAITSTNAIHLYYDLDDTLASWRQLLRPGGRVHVQSGNIGVPDLPSGAWIIDETVAAINGAAEELVRADERWGAYRDGLEEPERRARYATLREKFFLPVRPLRHYLDALEHAGFRILEVEHRPIEASATEWTAFLATYHEGVLGWVGGSERIEGEPPTDQAVADRLELLAAAVERVFGGPTFEAVWTYVDAEGR